MNLPQLWTRAQQQARFGAHQQLLVGFGDGDMAGVVAEVIEAIVAVLGARLHAELLLLGVLEGKGARRQVQHLLREGHQALVAVLGFMHHAVTHGASELRIHRPSLGFVALPV